MQRQSAKIFKQPIGTLFFLSVVIIVHEVTPLRRNDIPIGTRIIHSLYKSNYGCKRSLLEIN